ncbi:MAG: hypothetical protein ACO28J_13470, partial [Limnohabitans sp.]
MNTPQVSILFSHSSSHPHALRSRPKGQGPLAMLTFIASRCFQAVKQLPMRKRAGWLSLSL